MSTSGEPDAKKQRTDDAAAPSAAGDSAAAAPSEPVAQYVCTATLAAHKRAVSSVKFSSDGKWMASSSADTTVRRARAARTAHRTPHPRGREDRHGPDSLSSSLMTRPTHRI